MSEYLASGVPILVVGPSYAAMVKYLQINNAAIIVESATVEAVKAGFSLLNDSVKVEQILQNALALAVNETGVIPMRKKWENIAIN